MLILKNLRTDDDNQRNRVIAYLRDNPHEGVRERPEDQLILAQKTGLVLVIEKDGQICGCSFVYKFSDKGVVFSEIGTMRITNNGLRLQQLLAQTHMIQIFLEDYYAPKNEIFAVVKPGTDSEHVLSTHVKMERWNPPALLLSLRERSGIDFSEDKYCLTANTGCVARAFSDLRTLYVGNKRFKTPNGDATLQFDLGWFCDDVLAIPT